MSKKRPAFVDLTTDSDSELEHEDDDNDSNEDPDEPPKVHRGRATLYSLDDLNIPREEMRLRPEYQNEKALRKLMHTLTYEDLLVRAMQSPIALQRFFGIKLPPLPEDQTQIDTESDDTQRIYNLADRLFAPIVFELLLRRDFGIAYKSKHCSAKTKADRDMVSESLHAYAPLARREREVSKLQQLIKLRQLYVWIASAGKKTTAIHQLWLANTEVEFTGDGLVQLQTYGRITAPLFKMSVPNFLQYHYRKPDLTGRFPTIQSLSVISPRGGVLHHVQEVIPFEIRQLNFRAHAPILFEGENSQYFKAALESYENYEHPTGFFELKDGEKMATTVAIVDNSIAMQGWMEFAEFVPGYIILRDLDGRNVYFISTDPLEKSFVVSGRFYTRQVVTLSYIDDNRNVSPRVVIFCYTNNTLSLQIFTAIIVVDLPIEGLPKIRQYKPVREYPIDNHYPAVPLQTNFISWRGYGPFDNTQIVFDPSNGKIAQYNGVRVGLQGNDEHQQNTYVALKHPAVAFNFASPQGIIGEVTTCTEGSFFPVNELLVHRTGIVIDGITPLTVFFKSN